MREIPYGRQEVSDADINAVAAALRDPFLTQGPRVGEFERKFAERVGSRFAVAFNSGTAALHAAYFAAGIRPGRSVLTSPITFVATANASRYLGGEVRFADVDDSSMLLEPAAAERAATEEVRAIVPVHFTGEVAPMAELAELAARMGWVMIEDAAHALGASYLTDGGEVSVGACAHSAMCCFSFHPVKHITTGEGGMVTTNDPELQTKLSQFRTHGITRDPARLTHNEGPWYYEQHELGFNYRISDFQCALGSSQLENLERWVARRRQIALRYDRGFSGMPDVTSLRAPAHSRGAHHIYVIRVAADRRLALFNGLREAGIGANVHYIPVHLQPYYRARGFREGQFPTAERYYSEAITLPLFPALSDEDVDHVVAQVSRLLARS